MRSNRARNPVLLVTVCAVYFGLGKLGLAVGGFDTMATAVWPPSGFALAAMILFGPRIWSAIFFGAFLIFATTTGQIGMSITIALGHTLEALVGAALVVRVAGGQAAFTRAHLTFRLVAIAALIATPISATFSVQAITFAEPSVWRDHAYAWMTLWLANLTGVLVVAPLTLLWSTTPFGRVRWFELLEALLVMGMMVVVGLVVFGGLFPSEVKDYPLEFLCLPMVLWAAFRCGRREVATVMATLSGIAVWGTLRHFGPFARDTQNEALVLVQVYISVMAVTGVVLASSVAENKQSEAKLRELATTDPLTGLANYRQLIEVMRLEIARSNRTKQPFTVIFVDMNGLKRINDAHGHLVGSRALSRVADALRRSCRTIDTPARYGGDEFALVLPETDEAGAYTVLRRVGDSLAADVVKPAVSVSGGVAVFPRDGGSPALLLRAADRLLYDAKGRRTSEVLHTKNVIEEVR
jgi:diguanylate cyclase (GGDEF)-like protein